MVNRGQARARQQFAPGILIPHASVLRGDRLS